MKRRWLVTAVVLLLVLYAGSKVDWRAAGRTMMAAALLPLALAVVVNLLSVVLRGVRWWIFLRRVGPVSLALSVRGALVGSGFNNLLIANGGDATRAMLIARVAGVSGPSVVATLALDRLFDPICFMMLLFGATFFFALPDQLSGARTVAGITLVGVVGLLVLLVRAPPAETRNPIIAANPSRWRAQLRVFRQQVATLSTTRRFIMAMIVSAGVWLLQICVFALVARSVGIGLPIGGTVAALLLTNTGLVLRATPGNVGYFQFAYTLAAVRFGVAADQAVASALLLQLVQIVPTTLLALAIAVRRTEARRFS